MNNLLSILGTINADTAAAAPSVLSFLQNVATIHSTASLSEPQKAFGFAIAAAQTAASFQANPEVAAIGITAESLLDIIAQFIPNKAQAQPVAQAQQQPVAQAQQQTLSQADAEIATLQSELAAQPSTAAAAAAPTAHAKTPNVFARVFEKK
jgi:hypothetical protein